MVAEVAPEVAAEAHPPTVSLGPLSQRPLDAVWALVSGGLAAQALQDAMSSRAALGFLYVSIHVIVTVLFLVRRAPADRCREAVPITLAVAGTLYPYLYRPTGDDSMLGAALLGAGAVGVLASTVALGRSYAVLPAFRGLKTRGPYSWVRHPLYLAYLVLDTGILVDSPTPWNFIVSLCGWLLLLGRIWLEERLLARTASYEAYSLAVPWRLLPGVF